MPRYQTITAALRQQIRDGVLAPGDVLPSYRQLMLKHGVTVGTVRQAMLALQADGLVHSVHGIGCVVASAPAKRHRVGFAVMGYASSPSTLARLATLHDELDRLQSDLTVRFVPQVDEDALAELASWAMRQDGVILHRRIPTAAVKTLIDAGVPVVVLGELLDGPCPAGVCHVTLDMHSTTRLAVSHLLSLGHRRIMLYSHAGTRYFQLLHDSFFQSMDEHGLAKGAMFMEHRFTGYDHDHAILKGIREQDKPPTAIIVEEASRATQVIRALQAEGMSVPGDMSVLAIAGVRQQEDALDQLTRVITSSTELIARGAAILTQLLANASPAHGQSRLVRIEKIAPAYFPGQTCGRPSPTTAGKARLKTR